MANLHALVDGLTLVRNNKDVGAVMLLIQKAVTSLLEGLTPHVQVNILDWQLLRRLLLALLLRFSSKYGYISII